MQLRQFHLQLAFAGSRMAGKNIEDQLGSVNHPALDDFFYIALLGRTEIVIKQQNVGVHRRGRTRDLFQLARANQRGRIRPITALQNFSHDLGAGAFGQRAQFRQRFVCIKFGDAGLAIGSRRARRAILPGGLRCADALGRIARRCCLGRNTALCAPAAHIQTYQECALALRFPRSGDTPTGTRCVAGFLAVRASQTEKACLYPSVPEALAAATGATAVAATFSG